MSRIPLTCEAPLSLAARGIVGQILNVARWSDFEGYGPLPGQQDSQLLRAARGPLNPRPLAVSVPAHGPSARRVRTICDSAGIDWNTLPTFGRPATTRFCSSLSFHCQAAPVVLATVVGTPSSAHRSWTQLACWHASKMTRATGWRVNSRWRTSGVVRVVRKCSAWVILVVVAAGCSPSAGPETGADYPGTRDGVERTVREVTARLLKVDAATISMDRPISDPPWSADDLDLVEIVMELEKRLGIEIADASVERYLGGPLAKGPIRRTPNQLVAVARTSSRAQQPRGKKESAEPVTTPARGEE